RSGARLWGVALVLVAVAGGGFLVMRRGTTTTPAPVAAPQTAVAPQPTPSASVDLVPTAAPPKPQSTVETQPAIEKMRDPVPEKPKREKRPKHEKKLATGTTTPVSVDTHPVEAPKPQGSPAQIAYKEGMALFEEGNPRGAIPKLQEAVRIDGNYADAFK